jgi:hypothetical protein
MLNRLWEILRRHPSVVGLAIATALAGMNVYILGRTYQIGQASRNLATQTMPLKANLAELQRAKEEGFASLRTEITQAQEQLDALRRSFPQVGAPFDLYRRGRALAQSNGLEIMSIERGATEVDDTTMGQLSKTTYTLKANGSFQHCLTFMSELEDEGLKTVAIDNIQIDPVGQVCAFTVKIAGRTSAGATEPTR